MECPAICVGMDRKEIHVIEDAVEEDDDDDLELELEEVDDVKGGIGGIHDHGPTSPGPGG
jgi:hypothetical protein